jgi:hypothetical protein
VDYFKVKAEIKYAEMQRNSSLSCTTESITTFTLPQPTYLCLATEDFMHQEIAYIGTEETGFVMIEQNINITEMNESNGRHFDWLMSVCSMFTKIIQVKQDRKKFIQ